MLITKTNPVGADALIQKLQTQLHDGLAKVWGYQDESQGVKFKAYGRAYKNQREDGYVPEVYTGNNEYHEVFFDDTLFGHSFFLTSDEIREGRYSQVSIIYALNIDRCRPGIGHRGDEEVKVDVLQVIRKNVLGFKAISVVTGLDNVFREFARYRKNQTDTIRYRDMHPFHIFRINLSIIPIDKYC